MTGMLVGLVDGLATLANQNFSPVATPPPQGLVAIGYFVVAIGLFGAVAAWWLAIWSVVEDVEERMRGRHLAHAIHAAAPAPRAR